MTPIESIYEIKSEFLDLQVYLHSRDKIVSNKAKIKYLKLINRFFRENQNYVQPEQRGYCLGDRDYFMGLMESAIQHYYLETDE
jgi:hypothetical protein